MADIFHTNDIVIYAVQGRPRFGRIARITQNHVFTIVPLKGCMQVKRKASELISYDKFTDAVNLIKK